MSSVRPFKVYARLDPNMGNLIQREYPQIRVEQGWGNEHKKLQYIRNGAR